LRDTKDSDLVVVFAEKLAAVLGLLIANLGLASATGDGRWDAARQPRHRVVLVGVATFLAVEVKSLLVGEAAVRRFATRRSPQRSKRHVVRVLRVLTLQQGPGEVVLAIKLAFTPSSGMTTFAGSTTSARLRRPTQVKWIFVEPASRAPAS
jgi:hypothetical protein